MSAAGSNPLLSHAWGISPGADRVWAQINGFAPSTKPWERVFVILQAAIDDSYTEGKTFVFAGYIATAEAWAGFSRKWEELLPFARPSNRGIRRFKMSEMVNRMDDVRAFHRVIEEFVSMSVYIKFDIAELRNARERIWIEGTAIDWGFAADPHSLGFELLLGVFHTRLAIGDFDDPLQKILSGNTVNFIFDDQSQKGAIREGWDRFKASRAEDIEGVFGDDPDFLSDEKFLPLQAADFWAWWVREGYETGAIDRIKNDDFGTWRGTKHLSGTAIEIDEEGMVQLLMQTLRGRIGMAAP
ncbi:MAG: hypothetical protein JO058_05200, partial [Alphaproteobacteria bacterium]|nr:hypothetical protein [Alphaproteobacteria bacterium]